jgi:hypothetical protein
MKSSTPAVLPTRTKTKVLDPLRERVRYLGYSLRTEQDYVHWVRIFILPHGLRHPSGMGVSEAERFPSWLNEIGTPQLRHQPPADHLTPQTRSRTVLPLGTKQSPLAGKHLRFDDQTIPPCARAHTACDHAMQLRWRGGEAWGAKGRALRLRGACLRARLCDAVARCFRLRPLLKAVRPGVPALRGYQTGMSAGVLGLRL